MSDDTIEPVEEAPRLPRHLAVLVGSLQGPADLGANHDTCLSYPAPRDGAATA